ncbi:hypothetical protein ATL41_1998 [Flavimobilis soli]|uniref:Uncharacterized protein n=1 Tax=Flavimobilis soli TaxID=442709 RepID=A0A2A9EEA4_9MICO|nr:hypothetical protein [Flavimobilis soli]PFG37244.1 hypothetical protein ATL41_1998 [Flavimobilis soli]
MAHAPDPTSLAPHLDAAWVDDFVVRLRLRDVPGDRIGDALAEVDAHCADSGETALEAFGDPTGYADSLDLPSEPDEAGVRRTLVGSGLQIAGLLLAPQAVGTLATGGRLPITAGAVTTLAVTLAVLAAVATWHDQLLRHVLARPWPWSIGAGLLASASVLPMLLWESPVADVDPWVGIIAAVALLAAGVVVQARALGAGDPVLLPGAERPAPRVDAVVWMMPAAAVVLSAFAWFVAR